MFRITPTIGCVHGVFRWLAFSVSVLSGACTWQDTLHQASQAPEYLRMSDRIWVEQAPRWRLSPDTSLALSTPASVSQDWVDAANSGLGQYFSIIDTHPDVHLKVFWAQGPATDQAPETALRENSYAATMVGMLGIPEIPASQALTIHASDARGNVLQRMQLHINPKLWGASWYDPALIEVAFAHLAKVLQGDQQGG